MFHITIIIRRFYLSQPTAQQQKILQLVSQLALELISMKGAIILLAIAASILTVTAVDNNTTVYWNSQGAVLLDQYKFEDALNAFNNSLKINSSNTVALIGQGKALESLGRANESLESYQKAIELDPGNAKAWIGRGIILHDLEMYNESLQSYNKAIELDPSDGMAFNDLAWLYYKQGNNIEALANVNRSIEILGIDLAAALDTKGMALFALGKNEEALGYINRTLELDPIDSIVWIHKGTILKAMGKTSESEAAFARAKELPAQSLTNESV